MLEQNRVDFDRWVHFLVWTLAPVTGQCNWFRHYHENKNEYALQRYQQQALPTYEVVEGQLRKTCTETILGGRFSGVDTHIYPWVDEWALAGPILESYPRKSGTREVKI